MNNLSTKINPSNVLVLSTTTPWKKTTSPTQRLTLEVAIQLLLNKIILTIFRLLPPPKETAAPSAPGSTNASGADASIHAPKDKETSPLDASPDKDIMETNDTGSSPITTPTITILRRDFQAAARPNASPEFVKKYPTNRAMIDAVIIFFWKLITHILAVPE
ncbi:unnamed protein product [Rhizophagus irregularis]|nr:unnamed protein product [Rhizophagus irregularis]